MYICDWRKLYHVNSNNIPAYKAYFRGKKSVSGTENRLNNKSYKA